MEEFSLIEKVARALHAAEYPDSPHDGFVAQMEDGDRFLRQARIAIEEIAKSAESCGQCGYAIYPGISVGPHPFVKLQAPSSEVTVGTKCDLEDFHVFFRRPNCKLVIGNNCRLRGWIYFTGAGSTVTIGDNVGCNGRLWMNLAEANDSVTIGDGCLFSSVRFRTSDSHPIYDEGGERINPSRNIVVGNRVWIAEDALLLKGATIGDGAAIGARSLVTGEIPAGALAAGSPARVLRENICWAER